MFKSAFGSLGRLVVAVLVPIGLFVGLLYLVFRVFGNDFHYYYSGIPFGIFLAIGLSTSAAFGLYLFRRFRGGSAGEIRDKRGRGVFSKSDLVFWVGVALLILPSVYIGMRFLGIAFAIIFNSAFFDIPVLIYVPVVLIVLGLPFMLGLTGPLVIWYLIVYYRIKRYKR